MKFQLATALLAGSMVFYAGCSAGSHSDGISITNPAGEAALRNQLSGQTGEKATAVSETTTGQKHASGLSELSNIIDVRIADDKITTSYDKADAGIVSLDIRNDSGRSLNLILLKTDLSADQIPIKAGKIDFSGKTVALSGSLLSNPLPAGGTDSIVSDLDPGNYILMAYAPGNVRAAITQRITVQAPGT